MIWLRSDMPTEVAAWDPSRNERWPLVLASPVTQRTSTRLRLAVDEVGVGQRGDDVDQCVVERLVLPNAKNGPPSVFERRGLSLIAIPVAPDLCRPELPV